MRYFKFLALTAILSITFSCNNEPLEGDFPNQNQTDCIEATQATVTAAQNFATATEETYTDLCMAYRTALENQIDACGDSAGALQQTIDSLGDCMDDEEPADSESVVGMWEVLEFTANVMTESTANGITTTAEVNIVGSNMFYDLNFTDTAYTTDGGYDITVTTIINGMDLGSTTDSYTQVMGSGTYSTSGDVMTVDGSFFEFDFNGMGNEAFEGEQMANYALSNNGNTLTFSQNDTETNDANGISVVTTTVSTSVWTRVQ